MTWESRTIRPDKGFLGSRQWWIDCALTLELLCALASLRMDLDDWVISAADPVLQPHKGLRVTRVHVSPGENLTLQLHVRGVEL